MPAPQQFFKAWQIGFTNKHHPPAGHEELTTAAVPRFLDTKVASELSLFYLPKHISTMNLHKPFFRHTSTLDKKKDVFYIFA